MKRIFLLYFVLLMGLYSCEKYASDPIEDWTPLNDFPGQGRASASGFVVGDKAYICLGRSGWNGGFLKDLWEYDSQTDQWTRRADFPGVARVKAVAGAVGTKAYVGMGSIGAYSASNQFSDFWEYDTQTDAWTQKASFPGRGMNDLFSVVIDSCLYTCMGYTGEARLYDTYKYDPKTDEWTKLPDCPVNYNNPAGFAIGSDFYIGSGFDALDHKDFYRFQTKTKRWSRVASLPGKRILSNGLTIHDKGYILLGRRWDGDLNGGGLLSDILEYDPMQDSWTKRGNFPGGGRQNAVVFSIGEKGYVVMGENDDERKQDVWMFKP